VPVAVELLDHRTNRRQTGRRGFGLAAVLTGEADGLAEARVLAVLPSVLVAVLALGLLVCFFDMVITLVAST